MLPDFIFIKRQAVSIWIPRKLACEPIAQVFADAELLLKQSNCVIVKDQRKVTIGRMDLEYGGSNHGVYLKRYNAHSWRWPFLSLFTKSAALRSLKGAAILTQAGVATARPIAAVEFRRWGMLRKSFYVSEEITGGKTADVYWRDELAPIAGAEGRVRRRRFLQCLAVLFETLHRQHVYHNDLKDANILVVRAIEQEQFYLLDLEGVRRYRELNQRRRLKNLVQLNRTFGSYLKQTEKLQFLQSYLAASSLTRHNKRYWSSRILHQSRRLDRQKMKSRT